MDLNVLKKIKALEPDIETVYISAILVAKQFDLKFVDAYSIETKSLSYEMVIQANFQGKKIYSWTANTEYSINKALRFGVNGIITDYTLYAFYFADKYGENLLIKDIVEFSYDDN